jgi:hypothetical protein
MAGMPVMLNASSGDEAADQCQKLCVTKSNQSKPPANDCKAWVTTTAAGCSLGQPLPSKSVFNAAQFLCYLKADYPTALEHSDCAISGVQAGAPRGGPFQYDGVRFNGASIAQTPGSSTLFPSGLTAAATWEPELLREWGAAMGREVRDKGAAMFLCPAASVIRLPQGGRNGESIAGEDPVLGKHNVRAAVEGIQSNQLIANPNTYLLNNVEDTRWWGSQETDERTIMEIYLPPFEGAVEAGAGSTMCSYNKVRVTDRQAAPIYSCQNPVTLKGYLKERLNFSGFVVTDWGAAHSASLRSGLDWCPTGSYFPESKIAANSSGPWRWPATSGKLMPCAKPAPMPPGGQAGCAYQSGPLIPYTHNASAPETLVLAVDGVKQRVPLTEDVRDATALAALLNRSLTGVSNIHVAIPVSGSNRAYPHGAVGLSSASTGSDSFISIDASSGPHASALFGSQGGNCGVSGATCPTGNCCVGPGTFNGAGLAGATAADNGQAYCSVGVGRKIGLCWSGRFRERGAIELYITTLCNCSIARAEGWHHPSSLLHRPLHKYELPS